MDFQNNTPYPHAAYKSIDQKDNLYHNLAFRGTYRIENDGQLTLLDSQQPVASTPLYDGEVGCSSLIRDTHLSDFKPNVDIIVHATAYAPEVGREIRIPTVTV